MANKLRTLAIRILEEVEEHVENHKLPNGVLKKDVFDDESWYEIEDAVYDILYDKFVGK
jgi:hypothetical protein